MTIGFDPAQLVVPYVGRVDVPTATRIDRVAFDPKSRASATDDKGHEQVAGNRNSQSATRPGSRQCRTCAERKYKDVSNDPSVSFQSPTSLAPGTEMAAVSAHEQEHVSHNAAEAARKGMQATSTVTIHTDVCPECGRVYVSGGTTRTTYSRKVSAALDEDARGLLLDATA